MSHSYFSGFRTKHVGIVKVKRPHMETTRKNKLHIETPEKVGGT